MPLLDLKYMVAHNIFTHKPKSMLAWDVTAEWTDFVMAKAYALFQGLRSAESAQHSWQFEFQMRFFFGELFDVLGVQVVRGKLSQEIATIPGRAVCR